MKANNFQSRQKKAYLVFFSCAAALIIIFVIICDSAFGRGAPEAGKTSVSGGTATQNGYITFPPSPTATSHAQTQEAPSASAEPSLSPTITTPSEPIYPEQSALLQFTGDVVLHSAVLSAAGQSGYIFDEYFDGIKKYLTGDMVFANLEGVIEGGGDYSGYPPVSYTHLTLPTTERV